MAASAPGSPPSSPPSSPEPEIPDETPLPPPLHLGPPTISDEERAFIITMTGYINDVTRVIAMDPHILHHIVGLNRIILNGVGDERETSFIQQNMEFLRHRLQGLINQLNAPIIVPEMPDPSSDVSARGMQTLLNELRKINIVVFLRELEHNFQIRMGNANVESASPDVHLRFV